MSDKAKYQMTADGWALYLVTMDGGDRIHVLARTFQEAADLGMAIYGHDDDDVVRIERVTLTVLMPPDASGVFE